MSDESEPRFDVIYEGMGTRIDYHFCRQWDDEGGCYGTRQDHGYSFEEAKQVVIDQLQSEIDHWRALTYDKWANP